MNGAFSTPSDNKIVSPQKEDLRYTTFLFEAEK